MFKQQKYHKKRKFLKGVRCQKNVLSKDSNFKEDNFSLFTIPAFLNTTASTVSLLPLCLEPRFDFNIILFYNQGISSMKTSMKKKERRKRIAEE